LLLYKGETFFHGWIVDKSLAFVEQQRKVEA